jgi:cyclopropane-fatty-acyl-phospholipid synthase
MNPRVTSQRFVGSNGEEPGEEQMAAQLTAPGVAQPNGAASNYPPTSVSPNHSPHHSHETNRSSNSPAFGLRISRWLVERALRKLGNPPIAIVLWDGQQIHTSAEPPVVRLRFHDRAALWRVALDPRMQFGEMYSDGRLDVDGDISEMMIALDHALVRIGRTDIGANGPLIWLRRALYPNHAAQAKKDIQRHYDLGNDFYRLWLDEQMLYTCAYFAESSMTIEQAQSAKMDHVARKIWLQPGEKVIEAGCGWGALALHLARRYGVTVRAFNTSHEQILYARARARAEGLHERVEFVEDDWRNIRGSCDAFVSVGMLEHVRPVNYRRLGDVIYGCLKPNGRGLIHSIGRNKAQPMDPWIDRHIFPGAIPPSISQMMDLFETRDFSVLDVENLRLHYALTLRHWLVRFEQSSERVREMFDDRFVRMWRAYLAGSLAAFEAGALQLFQFVFAPGASKNVPATRQHQYDGAMPPEPSRFGPRNFNDSPRETHNGHSSSASAMHDSNGQSPRASAWNVATS